MAKYVIDESTLTNIADAIRGKTGKTNTLSPTQMADEVSNISTGSTDGLANKIIDRSITELTAADLFEVTKIGYNAFANCTKLTSVVIPSNVTYVDCYAFHACDKLVSVTAHDNVIFQVAAFAVCPSLTEFTIPRGMKEITSTLFSRCTKLESVTIHDEVTTIKDSAFYGCTALSQLTIPASVTSIESLAFQNVGTANGLTLTMLGAEPPTLNSNLVTQNLQIIVPNGCGDIYRYADGWSTYAEYIKEIQEITYEDPSGTATTIQYVEGMTWAEWCESSHNTLGWYSDGMNIITDGIQSDNPTSCLWYTDEYGDSFAVVGGETIDENYTYNIGSY